MLSSMSLEEVLRRSSSVLLDPAAVGSDGKAAEMDASASAAVVVQVRSLSLCVCARARLRVPSSHCVSVCVSRYRFAAAVVRFYGRSMLAR